jgi:hypothetical protein
MSNDTTKLTAEYQSQLADEYRVWLRIRFLPGMEMLAQELATGRRIFEQDYQEIIGSPVSPGNVPNGDGFGASPVVFSPTQDDPSVSPFVSPLPHPVTKRRSQRWSLDATGTFPTLLIPEDSVEFYSTLSELRQALVNQTMAFDTPSSHPLSRPRLTINIRNVMTVEKIRMLRSFAQSNVYTDVAGGIRGQDPPVILQPLEIVAPTMIPELTRLDQEMMFKIDVRGGVAPYRYSMVNQPSDLYVTEDGYVRGFIEADQYPSSGFREFMILILVEDSAIPTNIVGLEFRYRLFAL